MSFEGFLFGAGFVLGFFAGFTLAALETQSTDITHACGECDHVGECGDYECRPGVDGWQLKAGAL